MRWFKKRKPEREIRASAIEDAIWEIWDVVGELPTDHPARVASKPVVDAMYAKVDELMPEWAD